MTREGGAGNQSTSRVHSYRMEVTRDGRCRPRPARPGLDERGQPCPPRRLGDEPAQTDAVREELAPRGITVSALHVGLMDTDMTAGIAADKADPADVAAQVLHAVESGLPEILAD